MNQSALGVFSSDLPVAEVLAEIRDQPAVLIQVSQTQGSVPRDTGTWMTVVADRIHNTIGGGHVEFEAIQIARDMLDKKRHEVIEKKFTLGATLGQCCGGVMHLRFQMLPAPSIDSGSDGSREAFLKAALQSSAATPTPVALVGGGHVGHALVQALLPLPFSIDWADSREGIFPPLSHPRLHMEQFDDISECISQFQKNSFLLIMSFTHAEDFEILRGALARKRLEPECFPFIGLIGSKTKWAKFRHRLSERGFSDSELAAVTCPIGVPGIYGKLPAVIAASVAAQLLMKTSP